MKKYLLVSAIFLAAPALANDTLSITLQAGTAGLCTSPCTVTYTDTSNATRNTIQTVWAAGCAQDNSNTTCSNAQILTYFTKWLKDQAVAHIQQYNQNIAVQGASAPPPLQ